LTNIRAAFTAGTVEIMIDVIEALPRPLLDDTFEEWRQEELALLRALLVAVS